MTPQYLLEIAGLPVTKQAVRRLTESTNSAGLVIITGDEYPTTFIRLIDVPSTTSYEALTAKIAQHFPEFNSDNADYWASEAFPADPDDYVGQPVRSMTFNQYLTKVIAGAVEDLRDQEAE